MVTGHIVVRVMKSFVPEDTCYFEELFTAT